MSFFSTRGGSCVTASQAILYGLASDGGLYVPAMFPQISRQKLSELAQMDYCQRASVILRTYLEDFTVPEIDEALRAAYAPQKFDDPAVAPLRKLDDNTYVVKVDVEPINVMELAMDAEDEATASFFEKYADVDVHSMTDEEYAAYDADWAQAVIAMVKEQIPQLGYKPAVSLAVQVVRGDDGIWRISDDDIVNLDAQMIYYP